MVDNKCHIAGGHIQLRHKNADDVRACYTDFDSRYWRVKQPTRLKLNVTAYAGRAILARKIRPDRAATAFGLITRTVESLAATDKRRRKKTGFFFVTKNWLPKLYIYDGPFILCRIR
jgi:hypothetical protein